MVKTNKFQNRKKFLTLNLFFFLDFCAEDIKFLTLLAKHNVPFYLVFETRNYDRPSKEIVFVFVSKQMYDIFLKPFFDTHRTPCCNFCSLTFNQDLHFFTFLKINKKTCHSIGYVVLTHLHRGSKRFLKTHPFNFGTNNYIFKNNKVYKCEALFNAKILKYLGTPL